MMKLFLLALSTISILKCSTTNLMIDAFTSPVSLLNRNNANIRSLEESNTRMLESVSVVSSTSLSSMPNDEGEEVTKQAKMVNGEELELMLMDDNWDMPIVIDAYATWCGPCLLMAPEFEKAAQELKDKVKFLKLDTDKEVEMAGRLNIMGLPTLLFLEKGNEGEEEDGQPKAMLKERIEGALTKDSIVSVCNYHFFGGPRPESLF